MVNCLPIKTVFHILSMVLSIKVAQVQRSVNKKLTNKNNGKSMVDAYYHNSVGWAEETEWVSDGLLWTRQEPVHGEIFSDSFILLYVRPFFNLSVRQLIYHFKTFLRIGLPKHGFDLGSRSRIGAGFGQHGAAANRNLFFVNQALLYIKFDHFCCKSICSSAVSIFGGAISICGNAEKLLSEFVMEFVTI